MNNALKCLSAAMAAVMLFGCTSKSTKSGTGSKIDSSSSAQSVPSAETSVLPVLSIETKSKDADVMDFVKKPVAKHVAEAIASWTPDYEMPPEPYYEECTVTLKDGSGKTLLEPADAQVKVRGNWTTNYDKKPLRLKFNEKQSLLGLNGGTAFRNWLLLAEYKDASMLRNKAALYASREILGKDGLFAADCDFVQVEINGEYYGMYLLSDMQQVNEGRINITDPEKDYQGTDIGYFMEYDGYFYNEDELHSFSLGLHDNAPLTPFSDTEYKGEGVTVQPTSFMDPKRELGITMKSSIYSQDQHDFIENFVNNVYNIMYEAAYNHKAFVFDKDYKTISESTSVTPQQAVENVVDIQSLADMYIISDLTCDADIYWSSFYMTADFGADGNKKLTFQAPWDFDSSMGNKDRCIDGTGFYASGLVPDVDGGPSGNGMYETINPWLTVLAYEDWYQDIIKETWTKAYDDGVFDRTCQLIENTSASLEEEFTKNYDKWNNIIINFDFVNELSEPAANCHNEAEAAEFLSNWLRSRIGFLNSKWHK